MLFSLCEIFFLSVPTLHFYPGSATVGCRCLNAQTSSTRRCPHFYHPDDNESTNQLNDHCMRHDHRPPRCSGRNGAQSPGTRSVAAPMTCCPVQQSRDMLPRAYAAAHLGRPRRADPVRLRRCCVHARRGCPSSELLHVSHSTSVRTPEARRMSTRCAAKLVTSYTYGSLMDSAAATSSSGSDILPLFPACSCLSLYPCRSHIPVAVVFLVS